MSLDVERISTEKVASSNQEKLEIKISKMVQYLLKQGHVVYSIVKHEDKTQRRKYRASLHYWIFDREKLSKEK